MVACKEEPRQIASEDFQNGRQKKTLAHSDHTYTISDKLHKEYQENPLPAVSCTNAIFKRPIFDFSVCNSSSAPEPMLDRHAQTFCRDDSGLLKAPLTLQESHSTGLPYFFSDPWHLDERQVKQEMIDEEAIGNTTTFS